MAYDPINNPVIMLGIYRQESSNLATATTTGSGRGRFQYNSADSAATVRTGPYFAGLGNQFSGVDVGCVIEGTVSGGAGYLSTISNVDPTTGDVTVVAFSYN